MTTDARDEKWSCWIEHNGKSIPDLQGLEFQYKMRTGQESKAGAPFGCYKEEFIHVGAGKDIIAYRYKIKEPESGIADPDEEECLQLAYERMADESVKVSADELHDNVNKPKHYQLREGYEVYDLRQDLAAKAANGGATYDQYSDWDRAIEYIIRMWGKNRLEDAKKGRWYLNKLIGKLEAEESAR